MIFSCNTKGQSNPGENIWRIIFATKHPLQNIYVKEDVERGVSWILI